MLQYLKYIKKIVRNKLITKKIYKGNTKEGFWDYLFNKLGYELKISIFKLSLMSSSQQQNSNGNDNITILI